MEDLKELMAERKRRMEREEAAKAGLAASPAAPLIREAPVPLQASGLQEVRRKSFETAGDMRTQMNSSLETTKSFKTILKKTPRQDVKDSVFEGAGDMLGEMKSSLEATKSFKTILKKTPRPDVTADDLPPTNLPRLALPKARPAAVRQSAALDILGSATPNVLEPQGSAAPSVRGGAAISDGSSSEDEAEMMAQVKRYQSRLKEQGKSDEAGAIEVHQELKEQRDRAAQQSAAVWQRHAAYEAEDEDEGGGGGPRGRDDEGHDFAGVMGMSIEKGGSVGNSPQKPAAKGKKKKRAKKKAHKGGGMNGEGNGREGPGWDEGAFRPGKGAPSYPGEWGDAAEDDDIDLILCPRRIRRCMTWCKHSALNAGIKPRFLVAGGVVAFASIVLAIILTFTLVFGGGSGDPESVVPLGRLPPTSSAGPPTPFVQPSPSPRPNATRPQRQMALVAFMIRLQGLARDEFEGEVRGVFRSWVAGAVGFNVSVLDVEIASVVDMSGQRRAPGDSIHANISVGVEEGVSSQVPEKVKSAVESGSLTAEFARLGFQVMASMVGGDAPLSTPAPPVSQENTTKGNQSALTNQTAGAADNQTEGVRTTPVPTRFESCGNGIRDGEYEECDDGNRDNGDGCSDQCYVDPGYSCTGKPDVCIGYCIPYSLLNGVADPPGFIEVGGSAEVTCNPGFYLAITGPFVQCLEDLTWPTNAARCDRCPTSLDECGAGGWLVSCWGTSRGSCVRCSDEEFVQTLLNGTKVCRPCTERVCTSSADVVIGCGGARGPGTCGTCPSGQFKDAATGACAPCAPDCDAGAGLYQSVACSATRDRVCSPCSEVTCSPGTALQGCGGLQRGTCTSCLAGEYARQVGDGRVCERCSQECPPGQYLEGCGGNSAGSCVACPEGTFAQETEFRTSCSACTACPPGEYSSEPCTPDASGAGQRKCFPCAVCPENEVLSGCSPTGNSPGICVGCELYGAASLALCFTEVGLGTVKKTEKIAHVPLGSNGSSTQVPAHASFGGACAAVADLDGDGVLEVAVGARGDNVEGAGQGAVVLLFMDRAGGVKRSTTTRGSDVGGLVSDFDAFGWSVGGVGDADLDGVPDLLVGATGDDGAGTDFGAFYLVLMNRDGSTKASHKFSSATSQALAAAQAENTLLGSSIVGIGDLDGDNRTEVAVGARGGGAGSVIVCFFSWQGGAVNLTSAVRSPSAGSPVAGLSEADQFGSAVAPLGDMDGDGVPDLLVGAWGANDAAGLFSVLFLSSDGTVKSSNTVSSLQDNTGNLLRAQASFGSSAAVLGDVDKDGVVDVAIGSQDDFDGGSGRGAVYILFLTSSGGVKRFQKVSAWYGNLGGGLSNYDSFGSAVTAVSDLDSDGIGDILVGSVGDGSLLVLYMAKG